MNKTSLMGVGRREDGMRICDLHNWLNGGTIHQDRDHLKEDQREMWSIMANTILDLLSMRCL